MKQVGRLCKGIFDTLLVLVIVAALALLLVPRLLGAKLLVVLSQSMEPNMPMGSIVVSRPVPAAEVEVGDAITFQSPDPADQSALITHRVVELVGSGIAVRFRTQGDAVEEPDLRLVAPQHLVGRVWFSVPYLGYGVHFMRAPLGFILLLGLPAALLVGGELWSMIGAARGKTSAPERVSPLSVLENAQTPPTLTIGGELDSIVGAARNKIASVSERMLPGVPILEEDHVQVASNVQAWDVASWQQVQVLQARVEALQAEMTVLRQQLARSLPNVSWSPASEPLRAPSCCPRQVQPDLLKHETSGQKERAGSTTLGEFPITTGPNNEILPAPKPTPPTAIERLAVSLSGWTWLGLIASLVAVLLFVNFVLPKLLSTSLNVYAAQSLLWSCLAVQALLCWRYGLEARPALSKPLALIAILAGGFQVALFVIAGLFFGLDFSPYEHGPLILLGNLVRLGTMLAGVEISRAYLMVTLNRRNTWLALILLSLLFSLISVPLARFGGMNSAATFLQVAGEILLPAFCQNLLASLLAVLGGPVASLAYRVPLLAFEWLSPAQPDPKWIVVTILGSIVPILGYSVVRRLFLRQPAGEKDSQPNRPQSSDMMARVGLSVALLATGGIAQMLRGRKTERTAEVPFNSQGEVR